MSDDHTNHHVNYLMIFGILCFCTLMSVVFDVVDIDSKLVLVVLVTYILALQRPGGVFTLGVWCFSGFASLFPLVFAAVYWRRVSKAGAYACVLSAAATWLWLFAQSGYGANRSFLFLDMMPVATITAVSTASLVLVSLLTRPPKTETIGKFFSRPESHQAHA